MVTRRRVTEPAWKGMVPHTQLDDYAERFGDFFHFERTGGVLEVRWQRNGGPYFKIRRATTPGDGCGPISVAI